jgi:hypothetical protein
MEIRRIHWRPLPLAASLALAASAGLAADSPLRPERMREAMGLKLGAWQTVSTLVELKVEPGPGDDPAEAERGAAAIRAEAAKPMIQDQCLWDDKERLYLPGVRTPGNCEYSRLEARNGKFAITSLCRHPESSAVIEVAIDGTYGPKRLAYRSEAVATAGKGRIRVKTESKSRFMGKCTVPPVVVTTPPKGD